MSAGRWYVASAAMSYLAWIALSGALLLTMALSSAYIKRLPISTSLVYLALGVALGPVGFNVVSIDVREDAAWFERLTELAVIVSLFVCGAKLRLPLASPAWRAPLRLAGPLMLLSIAGVAAFAHFVADLPLGAALLVGAVLAPTDPVLASAIAVENASDHDRMRYGLSGEAGLNDGAAFPFVILGLLWLEHGGPGKWLTGWALHRVVWAVPAGLLLGYVLGRLLGRLAVQIRTRERDTAAPSDFLALAIIALSYVGAETIGAWGFLSVFASGLGLRHAEAHVVHMFPHPRLAHDGHGPADAERPEVNAPRPTAESHPPAENLVAKASADELKEPSVAAGAMIAEVLSFGDTAERLLEVMLVLMVGMALAQHWDPRAFALAFVVMLVVRPLGTQLVLLGTPTTFMQRALIGWFGVRGIGSLYYLAYALTHGLPQAFAAQLSAFTLSIVAISVAVHGTTASPLLKRYERALSKQR
jgi:NhaP-type Na+/H+ or K+/H+ antiporter